MHLTVEEEPGTLGLNFMWLPTWIGMNHALKKKIEEKISEDFVGKDLNEETLAAMDEAIIQLLASEFPEIEFADYVRGIQHVHQK